MSAQTQSDVFFVFLDIGLMLENSAVFQSQVGEQLIALRAAGVKADLLAVSRDRAVFDRVIGRRLREAGVHVILVKDRGFMRNLCAMAVALRRERRRTSVRFAYVRGIWGVVVLALANPFRRLPYVYDVRGALADETAASGALRLKHAVYCTLESWGIRGAMRVTAVSRPLADSVSHAHGVKPVTVIPCCVHVGEMRVSDQQAAARRRTLGFSQSDIVLSYCGGLSHYQQVPAMIKLWRRLFSEPDVQFLLLTNDDPHQMPEVVGDLADFGSRLHHFTLPHSEVPATLSAGNIGFMLRDPRELNRAASPVKFAEYLAAGLSVVASPGTGDASNLIEEHQVGVLVDPLDLDTGEQRVRALLEQLRNDVNRAAVRERALTLARLFYDWGAYHETFRTLYGVPDGGPAMESPS